MLFDYIRVFKDAAGLTDMSLDNQDESATIDAAITTTGYIYVAQKVPFTNMFMWVNTANTTTATLAIEYWDGTQWRQGVDVLDGTSSGGKTLARSGNVNFTLKDDYSWQMVADTNDSVAPTELQSLTIYNCYWLRISVSANMSAGTNLKELAYAFTSTQQLNDFDVEISGFYESFATGKTDWIPEILSASKLLVIELKKQGLIMGSGQVIDLEDFYIPCTYKALEVIYFNLGPSYAEKRKVVAEEFKKSLNVQRPKIDTNADGKLDHVESKGTPRMLSR
jgi:hypothetical protein